MTNPRTMTNAELDFARRDCLEAARAMDSIDRTDPNHGDRAGKYRDEGATYAAEIARRASQGPA